MHDIDALTDDEVDDLIRSFREKLGDTLIIPVHHYQRDEIVQFADRTGDSLELSRVAAGTDARFIVFCGVSFMAEIARVLARPGQHVLVPNRDAGCPLADYANLEGVRKLWDRLQRFHPGEYIPVTYANSNTDIKAFCGERDGYVCTSSNAGLVFETVLKKGFRVFFMPDRNLGINTAVALGLGKETWISGGDEEGIRGKRVVLWNGHCAVHTVFKPSHVEEWRKRKKNARIIVHPESDPEVATLAGMSGSTARIKKLVEESGKGSEWVIGTEYRMVERLAQSNPDKFVAPLLRTVCEDMSKNTRRDLLGVLQRIDAGDLSDEVTVGNDIATSARKAIERMLAL